jgi:integrase/recombinase XerD
MALRGQYGIKRQRLLAESESDGLAAWMRRYLEAQRVRGLSEAELDRQLLSLSLFLEWCDTRGVGSPREITRPMLERYQRHLFYYRKPNGAALSGATQMSRLQTLRRWFRWLVRQNHLVSNPAADIELPRLPRRILPRVLNVAEIEQVLAQPVLDGPVGLRDRAMLEVLYSTAIRRSECVRLALFDVDASRGVLSVRQGKGRKDRVVPIGSRALAWVEAYVREARPTLLLDHTERTLFLSTKGGPLVADALSALTRRYVEAADLGKSGSCHLFRHTAATQMLEHGADLRYVQEMLGHSHLATTQIYTHVSIAKLKAIHEATHPGAKLARRIQADENEEG